MKRLLIFYPFLASYRIGLFNRCAKDFKVKALLNDKQENLNALGFDLNAVNNAADFEYCYKNNGIYVGRHLLSTIYIKLITNFRPDLVWAHEFGIATIIAVLLKSFFGYTVFITCDDSFDLAIMRDSSSKRKKLRDFVIKRLDGMLVVSPECKKYFEAQYPNVKCKFIYFPIIQDDTVLSHSIEAARKLGEHLIEKYNIKYKKKILFVARFDPVKNIPLLINAYKKVANNDNVLILIGDGEMKNEVIAQIDRLKLEQKIILTGALTGTNLYAWYSISDIFVLPSFQECFGAVVNEALVAGCKCLVSDKAGASCLIDDSNGLVFESNNVEDLSTKLELLLIQQNKTKDEVQNLMPEPFETYYNNLKTQLFNN